MSQNPINLEIDGKRVAVPAGSMVMHAANKLGIYIPHFCYHKKLSIAANCRMCLVQVEKAPKPLPACATPVAEGMKVWSRSELALNAQQAVMEFLLINHPLDCPICDQGGECQLQDLAVGYGGSASRYGEEKRVVTNKNLGSLISTDMTRCIHCTRCVRFGQEIADIMELGMAHRGEHSEIMSFVGRTVDSELSGNVIDLCPVGALTSKPFRFSARTWELARRRSVSPHCGLGANLVVQVKLDRVLRVLPRENEEVNECWLSDKDRFSYEGLNSGDRLRRPLVKRDGRWAECDWQDALETVAVRLKEIRDRHGPPQIGALASPHSTLEELFLLQRLARGLGSGNVDFRLRQCDFRADAELKGAPWLGMNVADLDRLGSALVVGSTLRKDHPLLAHRLRQAVKGGAELNLINPVDDDLLVPPAAKLIVAPGGLVAALAQVVKGAAEAKGVPIPADIAATGGAVSDAARAMAKSLMERAPAAVLLGNMAQHHPGCADLHALAQHLAALTGARFGFLGEAANSVGGYLAGAVPQPPHADAVAGLNAFQMLAQPRKAYLLLGLEPEFDCHDPQQALAALGGAEFVVALTPFSGLAAEYADVILPITPFTETAGTFVSTEGRVQSFNGVVHPFADARPAWKVLRVLGNLLGLAGFEFNSSEEVRAAMGVAEGADISPRLANALKRAVVAASAPAAQGAIQRIGEVPIYQADPLVRRAESLLRTRDGADPAASMNGALMQRLGLKEGDAVAVRQGPGEALLAARRDDRLPDGCLRVPAAHPLTAGLGAMFGEVTARKAEVQQRMVG